MRVWASVAASLALLCGLRSICAAADSPRASQSTAPQFLAHDVDGNSVPLLPAAGGQVAVLVFVASDCPISNRYLPELVRLRSAVTAQGVAFWFVYPNLTDTAATVHAHQRTYGATGDVLRDGDQKLARLTGAKVTPEAAILVRHGADLQVVYAGRIDDRYLSIGKERPQATRHDLVEAIQAAVAGRSVAAPAGPAVGCGIVGTR